MNPAPGLRSNKDGVARSARLNQEPRGTEKRAVELSPGARLVAVARRGRSACHGECREHSEAQF
jgi:hypothetical protein